MHHAPHAPFRPGGRVDRVALISVHTCPLDQPGVGDAGGMNVYLREVVRRLGEMGVEVDVFTRDAGCPEPIVAVGPHARVIHIEAGPRQPIPKEEVTDVLCGFAMALAAFAESEASGQSIERAPYDVVHANYWMGGRVGRAVADRWRVPFLQSFHTLGKVKNLTLAPGDAPEPRARILAEERIVAGADHILAPTIAEAEELVSLYGASSPRVRVVSPGVDPDLFSPGVAQPGLLGWPENRPIVLFVGRLQPLKSPEVAIRATSVLAEGRTGRRRPVLVVVGGPSGAHGSDPASLRRLAREVGLEDADLVWSEPLPHALLAEAYRAATVTIMPSRTESFGLVALESQACGTPVVGSDVGGLRTSIRDGETGVLAPVGDVAAFTRALASVIDDPQLRASMSERAVGFARRFDWRWVARGLLSAYEDAVAAGVRSERQVRGVAEG